MNRRDAVLALLAFGAVPLAVEAQQAGKVPRIGVLQAGLPSSGTSPVADAFLEGLRDLGYVEGRNVFIEHRWAEERLDRLPDLAADLVRVKVDVIVAGGIAATRAAKQATATIPIVMSAATDPLGAGLIASLARPGGNITGSATLLSELGAKRLELLKEAFPKISRVAVLYDPTTSPSVLKEVEGAAERLKIQLRVLEVRTPEELEGAFREAKRSRADALSVLASPFFQSQRVRIASLAAEYRLPASVPHREYVETGGLMSYGPNFRDLNRRAAIYVDKILKGARPADLPVEQIERFELVINVRTAKALGLSIPPSLLLRADRVIE